MSASTRTHRPLLRGWSVLALGALAGAAFAALLPLSHGREARALSSTPDMLALSYLELSLARAPHDTALRVRVAERTLASGQFARARQVLAPLFSGDLPHPSDAELLRVEVDLRAWAAVEKNDSEARRAALAALIATLHRTDYESLPALQAERVAWVCAQVGLIKLRARILDGLAATQLADDGRLAAADAAHLEAEEPFAAARLHARRALELPEKNGAGHAALALERALGAEQPGEVLVLFRKLRARYGGDPRVLELGLMALAGVDDVEALAVARDLFALRPHDAALRQRIALLSAWTRPERGPAAAALSGKTATPLAWDGSDVSAIEPPTPQSRAQAIELTALFESLGAPNRALRSLDEALAQNLVDERSLWDLKVGVQLRLGQTREALQTLAQMDARFGSTKASVQRRADLLLGLGELRAAFELLTLAPGARAVEEERRITAIGWELGDLPRVRAAYRVIVSSSEATEHDVRRLWLLEREAGDFMASARTALSGWQRFHDRDFLSLALHTAVESKDERLIASVLVEARDSAAALARDPEDIRLQVDMRHARAHQALLRDDTALARVELDESTRLLEQGRTRDPELGEADAERWQTRDRQLLNLALASDDRELLARIYPAQAKRLTPRERVYVLHRLGRDEEAVDEAVISIREDELAEHDLGALQDEASVLSVDMPRQVAVLGDVIEMAGLTALRVGASGRFTWSEGRRLGAQLELTRLGAWDGPSLYLTGQDELAVELSAGLAESLLTLGVVTLDGRAPRPLLRFEQGLYQDTNGELGLSARVNDRSRDTAELRVLGVEDELAAHASLAFGDHFSLNGRGSAKLYSDRDRNYLGAGASLDAALGRDWVLPRGIGSANARLAGYVAPRFPADVEARIPEGTSWVGLGASLQRGQLSVPPLAGRRLSVLADVTAGWLVPQDELGWSGKLGLGVSVLGADQLSVMGSASNVVSTAPGYAAYTLGANYAVSQW